ncbi:MAG: type II toxin-antitoxin system HicB family antitoxin [Planctomycetota bacterium]|nr:MAG: type II toxin-antitoxin system HicB family antitoxin [Planctomycetota bacterium]
MRQVVIYPDREDGGWICEVPSLPGCVSQGETREEALENVRDAIAAWVEAAQSLGRDVPDDTQDVEVLLV